MDHDLAIKNKAAERYLLGELNETEMEEYEEHFFSCTICAQEVKLGSDFIDHAREVFKTDFLPEPGKVPVLKSTIWGRFWNSLRQPAPAFAFTLLAVIGGFSVYQNSVIGNLRREARTPQVLAANVVMLLEPRRAGDKKIQIKIRENESFRLEFDVPPERFSSFNLDVMDAAGTRQFAQALSAQEAKDSVQIYFPPKTLHAGDYVLVIRGVNNINKENASEKELISYPFELVFQH